MNEDIKTLVAFEDAKALIAIIVFILFAIVLAIFKLIV